MYIYSRANELIRFWGHEYKGHRAHYTCKNSLWSRYLKNRYMDSCQTLVMYVSCRANDLIRFWGQRSKVTGLIMYAKIAYDHIIIRTDGQITIKFKTCIYLAEPMNWVDVGVIRSKVMGLIMYAKIACERLLIRTDEWITIKLGTCMYLAEPSKWLDFRVIRSKTKGSYMYIKNSL